ncbi:MAG: hypothetical protein QW051_00180 [Candidatus Aenigmatarchaeota archaeon]
MFIGKNKGLKGIGKRKLEILHMKLDQEAKKNPKYCIGNPNDIYSLDIPYFNSKSCESVYGWLKGKLGPSFTLKEAREVIKKIITDTQSSDSLLIKESSNSATSKSLSTDYKNSYKSTPKVISVTSLQQDSSFFEYIKPIIIKKENGKVSYKLTRVISSNKPPYQHSIEKLVHFLREEKNKIWLFKFLTLLYCTDEGIGIEIKNQPLHTGPVREYFQENGIEIKRFLNEIINGNIPLRKLNEYAEKILNYVTNKYKF